MVSKASTDRLQGPKACQNGGLGEDCLLSCFKHLILFGSILEMIHAKFIDALFKFRGENLRWVPPGCLLGASGGLLGASWMLIGGLLHKRTCLQEGVPSC